MSFVKLISTSWSLGIFKPMQKNVESVRRRRTTGTSSVTRTKNIQRGPGQTGQQFPDSGRRLDVTRSSTVVSGGLD
ncbi:hypothetical protein HID58_069191 [Brassica napus]|uniref:Uncharacterized protein n=1 Tax=Brassica napus TaxID=3708 RepID=A0ABQ7XEW7_BRANA|nr:hypothetical protein HID58_069191 [Brassica napus]